MKIRFIYGFQGMTYHRERTQKFLVTSKFNKGRQHKQNYFVIENLLIVIYFNLFQKAN